MSEAPDVARVAAEKIVAAYHETNRLLPLAGGIPQPIGESTDHAVVLARTYLAEHPAPNPDHEAKAEAFREALRQTEDGTPEGTRDALERCAKMLDTHAPDCFPANEKGQVHFARAMMEGTADEIRAFLANVAVLEECIQVAVNLQQTHYGDATKLHLAMIGWGKAARAALAKAKGGPAC